MKDHKVDTERRKFIGSSAVAALAMAGAAPSAKGSPLQHTARPFRADEAIVGHPDLGKVSVERVSYISRSTQGQIAANLFRPADFAPDRRYPAVVVVHPIGGVKEQTAGLYALHLAQRGFLALAYDASYQGDSGGEPRMMELPSTRVEDISSSIDYLSTLAAVDGERIGAMGICGGGGYVLSSAQTEHRIKAVATVSAAEIGDLRRNGLSNSRSKAERMQILKDAGAQRNLEATGHPIRLSATVPESTSDFTAATPVMYREGHDYYRTPRGRHPNAICRTVFSAFPDQMAFQGYAALESISPRPVLLIAGALADSLYFSERAFTAALEPKEIFLVPGATHIDMYDRPQFVKPAADRLGDFFLEHLV